MQDEEGLVARGARILLYFGFYSVMRYNGRDIEESLIKWSSPDNTHKLAYAMISFLILMVGIVWTFSEENRQRGTYRLGLITVVGGTLNVLPSGLSGLLLWYTTGKTVGLFTYETAIFLFGMSILPFQWVACNLQIKPIIAN